MRIGGTLSKQGEFWAVEIPMLVIFTQGTSWADALDMAKDAVETVVNMPGFVATVQSDGGNTFTVGSSDPGALVGACLKQLRSSMGISIRDAAKALGSSSPTAYSVYETGQTMPSLQKFAELVLAIAGDEPVITMPEKRRA